jgi:hypothetical protein
MHAKLLRGHYFGVITKSLQAGGLLLTETRPFTEDKTQ